MNLLRRSAIATAATTAAPPLIRSASASKPRIKIGVPRPGPLTNRVKPATPGVTALRPPAGGHCAFIKA